MNWAASYFDLTELRWVDRVSSRSACEFSSQFGERKYFTSTGKEKFIPVGRRESIYLSAVLSKVQLVKANIEKSQLLVPIKAPLPEQTLTCRVLMFRRTSESNWRVCLLFRRPSEYHQQYTCRAGAANARSSYVIYSRVSLWTIRSMYLNKFAMHI